MKRTLMIGYGNTLRGDDGAGIHAVQMIAGEHPTIDCLALTELTPDLAETLSHYDNVLFVDASVTAQGLRWKTISPPVKRSATRSHALSPESLVGLSIELYDRCPQSIALVEIPAQQFDFGEKLSPLTRLMMQRFVKSFRESLKLINQAEQYINSAASLDQSLLPILRFLPTDSSPS